MRKCVRPTRCHNRCQVALQRAIRSRPWAVGLPGHASDGNAVSLARGVLALAKHAKVSSAAIRGAVQRDSSCPAAVDEELVAFDHEWVIFTLYIVILG